MGRAKKTGQAATAVSAALISAFSTTEPLGSSQNAQTTAPASGRRRALPRRSLAITMCAGSAIGPALRHGGRADQSRKHVRSRLFGDRGLQQRRRPDRQPARAFFQAAAGVDCDGPADHCRGEHQNRLRMGAPADLPSVFDSRAKKRPRLYVDKLVWPKGFPASRTWTMSHAARSLTATSRTQPKPIVMPRVAATPRPKVTGARWSI